VKIAIIRISKISISAPFDCRLRQLKITSIFTQSYNSKPITLHTHRLGGNSKMCFFHLLFLQLHLYPRIYPIALIPTQNRTLLRKWRDSFADISKQKLYVTRTLEPIWTKQGELIFRDAFAEKLHQKPLDSCPATGKWMQLQRPVCVGQL
jgi:hypothetical protein